MHLGFCIDAHSSSTALTSFVLHRLPSASGKSSTYCIATCFLHARQSVACWSGTTVPLLKQMPFPPPTYPLPCLAGLETLGQQFPMAPPLQHRSPLLSSSASRQHPRLGSARAKAEAPTRPPGTPTQPVGRRQTARRSPLTCRWACCRYVHVDAVS